MFKAHGWLRMVIVLLFLSLTGCVTVEDFLATPTGQAPTLEAISLMLTQTSAAPTATYTVTPSPTVSPTPTLTPSPTVVIGMEEMPGQVGAWVESQGPDLLVLSAERRSTVGQARVADEWEYAVVEVALENNSDQEMTYSSGYFRLKDADGETYEPSPLVEAPGLLSGLLQPGEQVRGNLAFLIPQAEDRADIQGYRLRYDHEQADVVWVDLGQRAKAIPSTGEAEPPGLPAGLPGVGQRVEESGIALVVEETRTAERVGAVRAGARNHFLLVDVMIENVLHARVPFNAQYFKLRSPEGYEYPAVIVPLEEMIHAGSLREGEQVRGLAAFEVPKDVTEWMLTYHPRVITEQYGEIRVQITVD